jgi:hypothetical protein
MESLNPTGGPDSEFRIFQTPLRSNEETFAHSQIKPTRRVPQVRSLNLGLGLAFSSHSFTSIGRGNIRILTNESNAEGGEAKPHLVAHSFQLFHENIPRAHGLQQRQPPMATEGNKMPITFVIVAPQSHRRGKPHGRKRQPQDPGSNSEPGAPSATLYFPEKCHSDILFLVLMSTNAKLFQARATRPFEGNPVEQERAAALIRDIMRHPVRVVRLGRDTEVYNAVGQGVRFENGTNKFITFVEIAKAGLP